MTMQYRERNGLIMATGALLRPFDPRSLKYRADRFVLKDADITQPITNLQQYRTDIYDQGQMGSCAAWSAAESAEMCGKMAGDPDIKFHAGWMYYYARQKEHFTGDSGSYPEDNLDLLRAGAPQETPEFPYVADASWTPPQGLEQAPRYDFILTYHPFSVQDGAQILGNCLAANLPVVLAMRWTEEFFTPVGPGSCVLPTTVQPKNNDGGHAILIHSMTPDAALVQNQWTAQWTPNAAQFGYGMRAGEFVIPFELLFNPTWTMGFWAVTQLPLAPQPQPTPPNPNPPSCADLVQASVNQLQQTLQTTKGPLQRMKATYRLQGGQKVLNDVNASGQSKGNLQ